MCQIIIKPKGLLTNIENLDRAKESNKDGFGVMWYDDELGKMMTYKTLDYTLFKDIIINTVRGFLAVIHLRYASRGAITLDNVHPFETSKGAFLCHNGTLASWGNSTISDTKEFASTFKELDIDWETPAAEVLVSHTIGTAYNKIVIMMPNGHVQVFNKNLFIEEDGILYSNKCHQKPTYEYKPTYKYKYEIVDDLPKYEDFFTDDDDDGDDPDTPPETKEKFKIFVYGSLKAGEYNHIYLDNATFLYHAQTSDKFAMVGDGCLYPHILGESDKGHHIIGEVYEIDEDTKETIDILEGAPLHYIEREIEVQRFILIKNKYTPSHKKDKVIVYTKADTTKRPSLIASYDHNLFIKEWRKCDLETVVKKPL